MAGIISINCIVFLILLNFTEADDTTLRLTLRDEQGNGIVLNWVKAEPFLANEHLPVWLARHSEDNDAADVVNLPNYIETNLGNFVFYRDIQKSSAVVYFERENIIFGNIGTKYVINALPLTELKREHSLRGSRYIKKSGDRNTLQTCRTINFKLSNNYQREVESDSSRNALELFPEILILITNDLLMHAKTLSPKGPLQFLVAQYLTYFNTISMVFDKLPTNDIKIHLNIAGIIVEDELDAFRFKSPSIPDDDTFRIDIKDTLLYSVPRYLRRAGFSDDSFDFFFISTKYQLWNPIEDTGYTTPKYHMYEMRSHSRCTKPPRFWGLIDLFNEEYTDCVHAARKIASLMGVNTKIQSVRVDWNLKNVRDLLVFASQDRNHCFLLNSPRSLRPLGHPVETLSHAEQCICYGHDPAITGSDVVGPDGCEKMLRCKDRTFQNHVKHAPLPIDGTPCDNNKVCWNKQCQRL